MTVIFLLIDFKMNNKIIKFLSANNEHKYDFYMENSSKVFVEYNFYKNQLKLTETFFKFLNLQNNYHLKS